MGLLSMLPLLASAFNPNAQAQDNRFQLCQKEPEADVRLACYDALARTKTPASGPTGEDRNGFLLEKDPLNDGSMTLTRQAGAGVSFSVACLNQITHVRVRLVQPWEGETVSAMIDGVPASGNWFIRDRGHLLEFGRGLVAIDELKRWAGLQQLTLTSDEGREVRIPLTGLGEAVKPLRQQCRW